MAKRKAINESRRANSATRTGRLLACGLALLGLAGLAIAAPPSGTLSERPWTEVTSPHFRIYSDLERERAVELLRHLEIMRATLGDASEESTYESGVPTIIVAVDDHDDYVRIGAPDYSGGYFFADLRENAILIEDSDETHGIQVILHEYAHYLNRQSSRVRFPRWFEEGSAEYVSHSELHDGAFEYGLAPAQYLATLGFGTWMPLTDLLEISDASALAELDGAMFYAQSWLLVHYLRSRPGADEQLADQVIDPRDRLRQDGVERAVLDVARQQQRDATIGGTGAAIAAMSPASREYGRKL